MSNNMSMLLVKAAARASPANADLLDPSHHVGTYSLARLASQIAFSVAEI
jgi:hypothetical protein